MKTPIGRAEVEEAFGNPANSDGTLDEAWEGANIRKISPPDGWQLYYQGDAGLVRVSGIRLHRLLEDDLTSILDEIWDFTKNQLGSAASDDEVRARLHELRLDQHGGGFNFRKITGGNGLSLHSYGIAIDWDPEHNPRRKPLKKSLPDWWFNIWNSHGWVDGRKFPTPDPMHVQFAKGV